MIIKKLLIDKTQGKIGNKQKVFNKESACNFYFSFPINHDGTPIKEITN